MPTRFETFQEQNKDENDLLALETCVRVCECMSFVYCIRHLAYVRLMCENLQGLIELSIYTLTIGVQGLVCNVISLVCLSTPFRFIYCELYVIHSFSFRLNGVFFSSCVPTIRNFAEKKSKLRSTHNNNSNHMAVVTVPITYSRQINDDRIHYYQR